MKTEFRVSAFAEPSADRQRSGFRVQALLITVLLITDHSLHAQGPLPPPGPPAPTFRTLTEVEPRIALNATNTPGDGLNLFIINQPGSYYLTTNLTGSVGNGILIRASGVTVDLRGFSVLWNVGEGSGIAVQGSRTNICIRNGTISGWRSAGVQALDAIHSQFENLQLSHNSSGTSPGLVTGPGCSVIGCTVSGTGIGGIPANGIEAGERSLIKACASTGSTGDGIVANSGSTVIECFVADNGQAGITVVDGCTVQNCTASGNVTRGIYASGRCTIKNCAVTGSQVGIFAGKTAVIADCVSGSNSGTGIQANEVSTIQGCSSEGNNGRGISAGTGSTVVGCSAAGNGSYGIETSDGSTISDCTSRGNALDGIRVESHCQVWNNTAEGNGDGTTNTAGIHARGHRNRIDGNHASANNGDGILVDATGTKNFVVRNTSGGQTCFGCFQFRVPGIIGQPPDGANVIGPIFTDATNVNANAWANFGQF